MRTLINILHGVIIISSTLCYLVWVLMGIEKAAGWLNMLIVVVIVLILTRILYSKIEFVEEQDG